MTLEYRDGTTAHGTRLFHGKNTFQISGEMLGITDKCSLTPTLARFFSYNRKLIETRLPSVESALGVYRLHLYQTNLRKEQTLSYAFLLRVLADDTLTSDALMHRLAVTEESVKVQALTTNYSASVKFTEERLHCVNRNEVTQAWYLFWDDLWRCNRTTISALKRRPQLFSPYYRTSLCYYPMSRKRLSTLLEDSGLFGSSSYFTPGLINRLYFYLNEIAFQRIPEYDIMIEADHHTISFKHLARAVDQEDATTSLLSKSARSETCTIQTGDGQSTLHCNVLHLDVAET